MINLLTFYFMVKTEAEWYWYLVWLVLVGLQFISALKRHQDKQRIEGAIELLSTQQGYGR